MTIVTKKGDKGKTGLLTGQVVDKDSERIKVFGTADELSAVISFAKSLSKSGELSSNLSELQQKILNIMSELACEGESKFVTPVSKSDIENIEDKINKLESRLALKNEFVIFGQDALSSSLNLARTISRRLERETVNLYRKKEINENLYIYLNRLSDYLFLLSIKARETNNV